MSDETVVEGEVIEEADVTEIAKREEPSRAVALVEQELSVDDLMAQVEKVKTVADRAMTVDVHYGKIPGTDKPTLLKPGAEKLQLVFRLAPRYRLTETWHPDGHFTVSAVCELYHVVTGFFRGEGVGLCSTREEKYAYRNAKPKCPLCGEEEIRRSKFAEPGEDEPGWYCWKKQGGCGGQFPAGDERITGQMTGKIDNPQLADTYNTVLKMAKKRAQVDAVLTATAAGDVFTQDMESPRAEEGGRSPGASQTEDPPAKDPPAQDSPVPSSADGEPASDQRVNMLVKLFEENGIDVEKTFDAQRSAHGGVLTAAWVESAIARLAPPLARDAA